jgi:hypothetical protein
MKYKEAEITGSRWVRARTVTMVNPLEGEQVAHFQEEEVFTDGEGVLVTRDVSNCSITFDPEGVITLLNPETSEPLGATMTHQQFYVALYSLYIQAAAARDATMVEEEEPEE